MGKRCRRHLRLGMGLFLAAWGIFPLGCSILSRPSAPPTATAWTEGKPFLAHRPFQLDDVTEFSLAIADPARDARWSVRLVRDPSAKYVRRASEWMFAPGSTSPDGQPLADRLADRAYINHVLDALSSAPVTDRLGERTADFNDAERQSAGLAPPLYSVQFRTKNAANEQFYDLRIGAPYSNPARPEGRGTLVEIVGLKPRAIGVVASTPLSLLQALKDFTDLRWTALSTFRADDVFEVEVLTPSEPLYFQREGNTWTDRRHQPVKRIAVASDLGRLTTLPIRTFIEDPREVLEWMPKFSRPDVSFRLIERKGASITLRAVRETAQTAIASSSDRPGAVFRVDASILKFLH